MVGMTRAPALIMIAVVSLALSSCGSPDSTITTSNSVQPTPVRPGLYELAGGRVRALGVLAYRDLEGGFWAVTDAPPGLPVSPDARVVAVIANAADLTSVDFKALEGRSVAVEGKLVDGASIRMAGPELEAESVTAVATDSGGGGPGY